jgi:hypothetical protein
MQRVRKFAASEEYRQMDAAKAVHEKAPDLSTGGSFSSSDESQD